MSFYVRLKLPCGVIDHKYCYGAIFWLAGFLFCFLFFSVWLFLCLVHEHEHTHIPIDGFTVFHWSAVSGCKEEGNVNMQIPKYLKSQLDKYFMTRQMHSTHYLGLCLLVSVTASLLVQCYMGTQMLIGTSARTSSVHLCFKLKDIRLRHKIIIWDTHLRSNWKQTFSLTDRNNFRVINTLKTFLIGFHCLSTAALVIGFS